MASCETITVLIIGATGHVGGVVLDHLVRASLSGLRITALVRSQKDADVLRDQYSNNVQTQVGSLEDVDFMMELAAEHTVVINCAPDEFYPEAIQSILKALSSQNRLVFYIGTSGASGLWDEANGEEGSKIWDDVADIDEILSQPDTKTHARTDRIILSANTDAVHTAIVSPTFIVGISASRSHTTPLSFPYQFRVMTELGAGFIIGEGRNITGFVNVNALARLYVKLVEDAVGKLAGKADSKDVLAWGPRAYYFGQNIELSQQLYQGMVVAEAMKQGAPFLKSTDVKRVSRDVVKDAVLEMFSGFDGADVWASHVAVMFGVNMRCRGTRAKKVFDYDWAEGDADAGIAESVRVYASANS